jgi:hypothetical protein
MTAATMSAAGAALIVAGDIVIPRRVAVSAANPTLDSIHTLTRAQRRARAESVMRLFQTSTRR